jgi:VIT1/CCC1 family predicted Fe2+/Mn2+ transporter
VSQESEGIYTAKSVRMSTLWCFFATVASSIVIAVPLILLPLNSAIAVSFVIAITTLILIAMYVSKYHHVKGIRLIIEYVIIGVVAAIATHYIGKLIVSLV